MLILVIICALIFFLGIIVFSVKGKEYYQNESINGHSPEIIGAIFEWVINLLPWYLKKLFVLLLFISLFLVCIYYLMYVQ